MLHKVSITFCTFCTSVSFSHADENDYKPLSGKKVRFPANSNLKIGTTTCQNVSIIDDDIREGNETFTVIVTPENNLDKVNGIQNMTITIQDDGDGNSISILMIHNLLANHLIE